MSLFCIFPSTYTSVTVKKGYKNNICKGCHESAALQIYANLLQHMPCCSIYFHKSNLMEIVLLMQSTTMILYMVMD
jgi:hypothetical protein